MNVEDRNERDPLLDSPIAITKFWLEDFIIKNGLCPPLNILAETSKKDDGKIDWNRMGQYINFVDFNLQEDDDRLLDYYSEKYLEFILQAEDPNAPYTTLFILPDFAKNKYMDRFMGQGNNELMNKFLTKKGAFGKAIALNNNLSSTKSNFFDLSRMHQSKKHSFILNFIDKQFSPILFYGNKISNLDLEHFDGGRGDIKRQEVISRAPFAIIQVLNPFLGNDLSPSLNTDRLNARNTAFALTLPGYEKYLSDIRALYSK